MGTMNDWKGEGRVCLEGEKGMNGSDGLDGLKWMGGAGMFRAL